MLLKSAADSAAAGRGATRRPSSIALRMAAWYVLSAFALIIVATGSLYWVLVNGMYREDAHDLRDNLENASLLLSASTLPHAALPSGVAPRLRGHRPDIYVRVMNSSGRVLVETPGLSRQLPVPASTVLATLARSGDASHQVLSRHGKPFLTLIAPIAGPQPRFLEVAMDRAHDEFLLARYRERLWLVLGVSLVLSAVVGYLIARGGMRPIKGISRTAERIRATTLHERIATDGLPQELLGLAETFNSMLDRLEQSFAHISQFSDDVAHELRTPINNLRGEIEVALGKARSAEEYREVLGSCFEECTRIARLIRTLLFLARADTAADALQRESVNLGEELTKVADFYGAAAGERGVELRVGDAQGVHAALDRTLFQQAIGNLISNALAHTPAGGSVELAAGTSGQEVHVTVTDSGCGIAPEHLPHVFERFYRIEASRTGSQLNAGLGLAVVKSIVSRHGGRVEIESRCGEGTQVRLMIPSQDPVDAAQITKS
jgi:two-component system heavy metal sensor histidine kinase CusS